MSEVDPYRPPEAELSLERASGVAVFTPRQIAVATFLGSVLAGVWMIHRNIRGFGSEDDVRGARVTSIGLTILYFLLTFTIPEGLTTALSVVATYAAHTTASTLFGAKLRAHEAEGGSIHSNWRVLGICLASIAIILASFAAAFLILPESLTDDWL